MYLIQQVTSDPAQSQNITLPDSTIVTIQIQFVPMQQGWFITNLTYGTFILNGLRITNSPNMLLPFQNQIPFGLACYSTANREPSLQQDFSSGASQLYILDPAEVKEYYTFLQTGVT
jgi:hypothetical protein